MNWYKGWSFINNPKYVIKSSYAQHQNSTVRCLASSHYIMVANTSYNTFKSITFKIFCNKVQITIAADQKYNFYRQFDANCYYIN